MTGEALVALTARVAAIEVKLAEIEQAMDAFPRELAKGFKEAFKEPFK